MAFLYSSTAAEDSAVVAGDRIRVDEVIVTNIGGSARFVQLFDSATLPANTAEPLVSIALPDATTVFWDPVEGLGGERFSNGIVVALSSTAATLTVTTGSEALFYIRGSSNA